MARIAHISDIHFGDACPRALEAAARALADVQPDCIVMTGDLTQAGRRVEFAAAAEWLAALPAPVVGCPGNHDAPVFALPARLAGPFRRFDGLGLATGWQAADGQVAVQAFNSARGLQPRLDWSQGRYRPRDLMAARGRMEQAAPDGWHVLACHHPPRTPSGARVRSDTRGAARSLAAFGARPRSLLLTGHVHGHFRFRGLTDGPDVLTAPSLASSRGRGAGNGFLVLDLAPAQASVTLWRFDGSHFAAQPGHILTP